MRNKIGDKERLGHILDYSAMMIEKAPVGVSEKDFHSNFILQAALQKWIEILGEACYHISKEFKSEHPNIDWIKIQGLRHVLVHEYFGIDLLRIWEIAKHYVPELKETVRKLYKEFE